MKHLKCKLKLNGFGPHGKFHGHHGMHRHHGRHGRHGRFHGHGKFHGHDKFYCHGKFHDGPGHNFDDQRRWLKEEILKVLLKAGKRLDGPGEEGHRRFWGKGRRLRDFEDGPSDREERTGDCDDGPSGGDFHGPKHCRKGMRVEFEKNRSYGRGRLRKRFGGDCESSDEERSCKRGRPRFGFGGSPNCCGRQRWANFDFGHFRERGGPGRFGRSRPGRDDADRGRQKEEEGGEETVLVRGVIVSRGDRSHSV